MARKQKRNRIPKGMSLQRSLETNLQVHQNNVTKPQTGIKQQRTIGFAVREVDEKTRKVRVSFSSEQPVNRFWGSEILCHDEGCVDLSRLENIGVSLFNHDRNVVIGIPENAVLDSNEKRAYADIVFDDDEESEKIYQKVKKGILRGVSVGYSVDTWEEVMAGKTSTNGRFTGPCYVATRWTPYEISIVSIPADDSVGVNRDIEFTQQQVCSTEREHNMELEQLCRQFGLDYSKLISQGFNDEQIRSMISAMEQRSKTADKQIDEKVKESVEAEAKRSVEIATLCREFDADPIPYIQGKNSVDSVRAAILEKVKTERAAIAGSQSSEQIVAAEEDKFRRAVTDGVLLRGGVRIDKPDDSANQFRGMKLRDLAVECLSRSGVQNAHRLSDDDLFERAVTPDSQFASILSNAVNKSMAVAYRAAIPTYKEWVGIGSNSDFKEATHYQISEAGDLQKLTQSGELKFDEMKDNGVKKQVATFGRSFGFTRQAMINDDLGVLTKIPQAYVRAANRGVNKMVYAILGKNGAIYDGKDLFHADHKNLADTAAAITTASLGAGRTAMRKQKNIRGKEVLNISPSFLIVPASKEVEAAQLLISVSDPSSANSNVANIFKGSMSLVVDAELDDYSDKEWYLAANSADIDTIEVTYLNGNPMPILESQVGFDYVGIKWRIIHDVGVTALDYKGLYKNDGA